MLKERSEDPPLQLLTFRLPQLPTSSHPLSGRPGMGSRFRPAAPRGAAKKRTQAFDSTVLGRPCLAIASVSSHESPVTSRQSRPLNKPPCSTVMLNLEQTCNNPRLHSLTRTVIRAKLSAQACQPFCCQRTVFPSRSECSGCTGTCLAGLT